MKVLISNSTILLNTGFKMHRASLVVLQQWYLLAAAMHLGSRGKGTIQC